MLKQFFKNNFFQALKELKSLIVMLFIAILIRTFIIEAFYIPSESMNDTLLEGDYLIATKYSYGISNFSFPFSPNLFKGRFIANEPLRGDVVIFKSRHDKYQDRYIKRVIGLPGDKIQIKDGILYINDRGVVNRFIKSITKRQGLDNSTYNMYEEILPNGRKYFILKLASIVEDYVGTYRNNTPAYIVPVGKYFVLGDNRDNSGDSRFDIGYVDANHLIAKARFIIFSFESRLWLNNSSIVEQVFQVPVWLSSFRLNRASKVIK